MEMKQVSSRAINAVGYEAGTLRIRFKQGKSYDYCHVPEHVYSGLMRAMSKGRYFNDHIKDKYSCR